MSISVLLVVIVFTLIVAYNAGRARVLKLAISTRNESGRNKLSSLPYYYGMLTMLWAAVPAVLLLLIWLVFQDQLIERIVLQQLPEQYLNYSQAERELLLNQAYNILATGNEDAPSYLQQAAANIEALQNKSRWLVSILVFIGMIISGGLACFRLQPETQARYRVEQIFQAALLLCSCIAILTTIGIVLSVLFESLRFFNSVPFFQFIFGSEWSPQMAIRADQVAAEGSFGALPLFAGTLLIAGIAMTIAVPTGLMSAIYLSEYASKKFRSYVKPTLEVLAGIPTVVYGFFAALTVAPFIRDSAYALGLDQWMTVSSESALAAGLVMGVMIIPFVSSLSDDVINAVPQSLRDGALGLGSTKSELVKLVVIPAALPGIVGGVLLAVSRAIGETMIVVMAAGLAAKLTANPLDSVTTVTVQIVTLLVGDQEFDSPKTLAAFALGLMLFLVTLALNYIALQVVRKYREQYD